MRYLVACAVVLGLGGYSFGEIIVVPTDYPTIQGAIDASSNGDTILIEPGTYYESGINISKSIDVVGLDDKGGDIHVTIDAMEDTSAIYIEASYAAISLYNLIITGGSGQEGGGVFVDSHVSTVTLENCRITGNTSTRGGGVYVWRGFVQCIDTVVENNHAAKGGGVYINNDASIANCIIEYNTAEYGGGVYMRYSECTLSQSLVQNNTALVNGGGIWSEGGGGVVASTVCDNYPNQVWDIQGDDTNEINESCSANASACCVNGACIILDENTCSAVGGSWSDVGTNCGEYQCPEPCLGDVNNDDLVDVSDLLTVIANWGGCP